MAQILSEYGYLIGAPSSDIQVVSMPTASETLVGAILQYIGATSASYTNGYFYKCVSDGAATPTYSWQRINVQPSGSGVFTIALSGNGDTTPYSVNKTPAEVAEAISAGKVIQMSYMNMLLSLAAHNTAQGTSVYVFTLDIIDGSHVREHRCTLSATTTSTWANIQFNAIDAIQDTYRISSLDDTDPEDYLDTPVQYIGATDGDYIYGCFYEGIEDPNNVGEYIWQRIDVQPASSAVFTITLTGSGTQENPYSVNKTPAELGDALDAGKYPVIMQYLGGEYVSYPFTWMEDDRIIFEFERLEDHLVSGDYHTVRSNKVVLEVDGTDWDNISIVTKDFDLNNKADKVLGATNGNFASLNASGNLADSGKKASDFVLTTAVGTAAAKDVPTSGNASASQVVMGNDTRLTDSRTPTSHNQAASTITAGTLAGRVQANATAAATLSNAQVRDVTISTTDLTAGTSNLAAGSVYIVYET